MKCLVTGVNGLVGSATAKVFAENGYEVIGLDNNMRAKFFGTPDTHITNPIDIRDEEKIDEGFQQFGPFDVIVHAAAQPSHDYSKNHVLEDFDINARGTVILLEATRKYCPNATFIYVSTDKVYGENMHGFEYETGTSYHSNYPFDESVGLDFAGARSPFGCSKAAGDMYVQEYGNYFGMKTACFRPGCITGKNHEGAELHGFLAYLAKCIRTGTTYKIFGNGKNVRDQIHANDLAQAFLAFAQNPKVAAVFNIGGGPTRAVSVLEAISIFEAKYGKKLNVQFAEARKGDRLFDIHDVSKFREAYPDWDYMYSLDDIFNDLCF